MHLISHKYLIPFNVKLLAVPNLVRITVALINIWLEAEKFRQLLSHYLHLQWLLASGLVISTHYSMLLGICAIYVSIVCATDLRTQMEENKIHCNTTIRFAILGASYFRVKTFETK